MIPAPVALTLAFVSCAGCAPPGEPARSAETERMVARLAALDRELDLSVTPYRPETVIAFLDQIPPPPDLRSRAELALRRADALLAAAREPEALALFEQLEIQLAAEPKLAAGELGRRAALGVGLAWLRIAERRNCVVSHGSASCLMPIRGAGVHRDAEPARQAARAFAAAYRRFPGDAAARWLWNVATLAAGDSGTDGPPGLPLRADRFAGPADVAPFRDVASVVGIETAGMSGGVVAEDLDGDGWIDFLVSAWGLDEPLRYFRNRGDGGFEERSAAAGLAGLTGGLNLVHADYDNDGDDDVLVLRGAWMGRLGRQPNSLLRNDGRGRFEDVTESAGLLDFHPTQTATWADFDGDGSLDLFVGNESTAGELHPCALFRNRRDGTFEEVAARAGAAIVGFVKGVAAGDFDGDGRSDIYLSRLGEPNVLLRNAGPTNGFVRFEDVTRAAGVERPIASFPTWFFDYDGDGDLDLFAGSFEPDVLQGDFTSAFAEFLDLPDDAERPALYRNRGDGTFEDVAEAVGFSRVIHAMGANFADVDGDGAPDLYFGTGAPDLRLLVPNRLFLQRAGRFLDATFAADVGHLQKGHGVAFADFDHDGDLDLFHVLGGAFPADAYADALFENPGFGGRAVTLRLEGRRSSRSALGARVRATLAGPRGRRTLTRTVSSGGSFGSSTLRVLIPFADDERLATLTVDWPGDGASEAFSGLEPGRFYRLVEGSGLAVELPFSSFRAGEGRKHAHH